MWKLVKSGIPLNPQPMSMLWRCGKEYLKMSDAELVQAKKKCVLYGSVAPNKSNNKNKNKNKQNVEEKSDIPAALLPYKDQIAKSQLKPVIRVCNCILTYCVILFSPVHTYSLVCRTCVSYLYLFYYQCLCPIATCTRYQSIKYY